MLISIKMFTKSVFITGCSRGIGLEFVKQLAPQVEHVFASCRSPNNAKELNEIADIHKHVTVLQLDVTKQESITKAVETISEIVQGDGLNCLINNAGINQKTGCITELTADSLKTDYETNAIAPAMVVKTCLPLLKLASHKSLSEEMSVLRSSILNISTGYASIEKPINIEKISYSYSMSKIGLNMLTQNLSIELKPHGILVVGLRPGWVKTDMGGENAHLTTYESVEAMLKVSLTLNESHTGMCYSWDGSLLPR